ncbi:MULTISPECIES: response regulator [Streptomyces]|uniref:DNA-binding response regulator n=2 Tax=Streptomyces TaxID=1883 RepID=A0A3M8FEP8_9ACTN|nr:MULTISPECIES: response regulator transcription factor [Streptomyces]KNE80334.1 LuxR family transcriptional regulator [Streptomyces fradiae]OFA42621.1 DNA-binding response regulator [Streptomyces fradiae]PQM25418.1 DNA-binding response regulator [Streptomyces xinghaiensis]RKM99474.1 DNA-binding response regulator [Streptomyces xinghaiensis]RNC76462.1 DNA-binding response regulator [Streptomyces xinghaiensis]
MSGPTVRVLVVDDHPIVRDGVALVLGSTSWITVSGYAGSGREAVVEVERLKPDVVLLDLRLPDMLAPEVIRELRSRVPGVKVVIFTAYPEHAALEDALEAGAHAVVVKDAERSDLVDIIRRVDAGERVVRTSPDRLMEVLLAGRLKKSGLTRREYEILRRVAMGETNPEIAGALGLTRNTVKTYLQRTLEKLGARNRIEALARASERGIL